MIEMAAMLIVPVIVAAIGGGIVGDWLRARRSKNQDTMDLFLPAWREETERARREIKYLRKVIHAYGVELQKLGIDVLAIQAMIAEANLAEDPTQQGDAYAEHRDQ